MDPTNAIEIKGITKSFKIKTRVLSDGKKTRPSYRYVKKTVIDNISLDIKKGEVLGVIGRNGSGKSTFLSMLAGILYPDLGTIERDGKIASILELGMGFHPDMSGRENIYLKGEMYGFTKKEMDAKLDTIINYSGLSEYIDNPVRTYSSGMTGRLAFSIMVNVKSDIMLVDEVLSVGDSAFIAKARDHFKKISESGKTVIFVSHNLNSLENMCSRVIWIEGGHIVGDGSAKKICSEYKLKMSESLDVIIDLAESGVPDAQYKLALQYYDEGSLETNYELYESWMKKAAEQGHTKAQVKYADILFNEKDEEKRSEAILYYQSAANAGDGQARMRIAELLNDENEKCEYLKTIYKKNAESGDINSEYDYADILLRTAYTDDDYRESYRWFKKAADDGNAKSMYKVANMLRDGIGVKKDRTKMIYYLEKAESAGNLQSVIMMGDLYYNGNIVPLNEEKAFNYYLKAAELGHSKSQYQVAMMYREGIGTSIDLNQSKKWFNIFSQSETTLYDVSLIYNIGDYKKFDIDRVSESYVKAIDQCSLLAISNIINMYALGTINDNLIFNKALDKLVEIAKYNNIESIKKLGQLYYYGIGVKQNFNTSFEWYMKASLLGDGYSKIKISEMYRDGRGVEKNIPCAIKILKSVHDKWFTHSLTHLIDICISENLTEELPSLFNNLQKIAECGSIDAIKKIGDCYYSGKGVTLNKNVAIEWFKKGCLLGDEWCMRKLSTITNTQP